MKVSYFSKMFNPAIRKMPKESKTASKSQKLLTYNGLISPSGTGTYTVMPKFQRSLDKLVEIINSHMSQIDAQKLTLPLLGRSSIWKTSGRWDSMQSEIFKLTDKNKSELCLQPTHEEEITSLLTTFPLINKEQLPILLYQVGPKFRNETAPRSGLLRCREFLMKDLYSFDRDVESATETYNRVLDQYHRLFQQLGLAYMCVEADCGSMGGLMSHEFHVEAAVGEDVVLRCQSCGSYFNQELIMKAERQPGQKQFCTKTGCSGTLSPHNAIEIGHCFLLGDRYSKAFDLHYHSIREKRHVMMGCYGIGVTRLLAASVEALSSEEEVRWPRGLAPYGVALILQKEGAIDQPPVHLVDSLIDRVSRGFIEEGRCISDVLVDDRQVTIGRKMAEARSLGIPWAVVVKNEALFETVDVNNGDTRHLSIEDCASSVSKDSPRRDNAVLNLQE